MEAIPYICSLKIRTNEMKKTVLVIGALLCLCLPIHAQDFFVGADFVSSYIWRGMKNGNAAIQPTIGLEAGGFSFSAWGSTELKDENNELDFTLTYEYKNLMFHLNDIYTQNDDEKSNYFSYSPRTTGHILDAGLIYTLSEKLPLSLGWYTLIAGNDYKENDKRAYSSYIELKYPFTFKEIDFEIEAGITPWEGMYADKLNVTNIALKAGKEIRVTDSFSFPIFGQVGVNPYEKKAFFVFGISL